MDDRIVRQREAVRRYREKNKHKPEFKSQRSTQAKRRYYRLKADNLCASCGKAKEDHRAHCTKCREAIRNGTIKWKQAMRDSGLCTNCGKRPCLPSMISKCDSYCEPCYLKKTSMDCLKSAKHTEAITKQLHKQNYRCAYTGELLVLGLNDSLDHVLPQSRYPELRSDPSNVEWVTRKVNCMKWDSTREEFLETARLVVEYAHQLTA